MFSTQILIEVKVEVLKFHFEAYTKARMVDIINMKVSLMEVDKETLEEEEVMEVIVATPLWVKWEDETPTPKVEDLKSFGTPECLEFDNRGKKHLALGCSWYHWKGLEV